MEALTKSIVPDDCVQVGFTSNHAEGEEENKNDEDGSYIIPTKLSQKYVVVEEGQRTTFLLSILTVSGNTKVIIK